MEITAKLFRNGRSQAVRIPKAFRFEGVDQVIMRKEGEALILVPIRKTWQSYAEEAPSVGDEFMEALLQSARPQDRKLDRVTPAKGRANA